MHAIEGTSGSQTVIRAIEKQRKNAPNTFIDEFILRRQSQLFNDAFFCKMERASDT